MMKMNGSKRYSVGSPGIRLAQWLSVGVLLMLSGAGNTQPIVIATLEEPNPETRIAEAVMSEAYHRLGYTLELHKKPVERSVRDANDGLADGELYRMAGVESLYPHLHMLSVPVVSVKFVVFSKNNNMAVAGWDSLRRYKVAYVRGIKAIEENLPKGARAIDVRTMRQAYLLLDAGRVDAVIETRQAGIAAINELGITGVEALEPPLVTINLYHYLHDKNKHLKEPLEAVLKEMERDGTLRKLQQGAM